MLFVAGRSSALSDEAYRCFNDVKREYEEKGMLVGLMTVDALLDFFFATQYEFQPPFVFEVLDRTMADVHAAPEAMNWVFQRIAEFD